MNSIVKYILVLFSFLVFVVGIQSQNKVIDSLKNELTIHTQKDTIRVETLNNLAFSYYRIDVNKTITYIEVAEKLSDSIGYKLGKAKSVYLRGVTQMALSNFKEAITYFELSEQLYTAIGLKKGISNCNNGLGIVYYYQGNYDKAIKYYNKSLQIDKEIGLKENIPKNLYNIASIYIKIGKYNEALNNLNKVLEIFTEKENKPAIIKTSNAIGMIYLQQGNYSTTLKYFNKSLELAEKIEDSISISVSLNNIGILYKKQENFKKALKFYMRSLVINEKRGNKNMVAAIKNNIGSIYIKKEEYNKAIKFLKESVIINKEINAQSQLSECLNNLGFVYVSLKKYSDAYKYYEEAKNINLKIKNQEGLSISYLGISDSYVQQKKYSKALVNILKSLEISDKLNLLDYRRDAHQLLSEIYENTNNYKKALVSHQQFKILNDSLFNKENIEKITQLEYEYKYKQKLDSASIRELELTKIAKTTSQDLEKSQRNYLWAIIGFLLISILLSSIIFYQKFRNIKSKNQNIIIEQKLLRSQMTPHFIFNSLSVLQGMILNKEEKKSVSYLSKFSKLLRIILENSREKMVFLSQELTAIENYLALQNLENESYQYTVLVDETIDLPLFKIPPMLMQPFVENAIEHAFGNQKGNKIIDVHLFYLNKELICTITDNGTGIDSQKKNENPNKKSLSTTITSERLKILSKDFKKKGSVTIEDRKKDSKHGTIVTLIIPYKIHVS